MFKKPAIIELSLIVFVTLIVWFFSGLAPERLSVGGIIIFSAGVMFIQSLIRDLWIKLGVKNDIPEENIGRCMCLESTLGTVVLALGIFFSIFGASIMVSIKPLFWPILVLALLIFDFLIKDFIVEWTKFRIRRVPNHATIRF